MELGPPCSRNDQDGGLEGGTTGGQVDVLEDHHTMNWMACVTPLLAGTSNLYEYGLAKDENENGGLTLMHLQMLATVI
jgi:hypothetical protein